MISGAVGNRKYHCVPIRETLVKGLSRGVRIVIIVDSSVAGFLRSPVDPGIDLVVCKS